MKYLIQNARFFGTQPFTGIKMHRDYLAQVTTNNFCYFIEDFEIQNRKLGTATKFARPFNENVQGVELLSIW